MREIFKSNNPVRLSWAEALLRDAGMDPIVLDAHASIMDGSVIAIQRRLMLPDDQAEEGRALLAEADPDPA